MTKWISWHCGRHSFSVLMFDTGANIKTGSALMGYSDIGMTGKYLQTFDKQKMEAVDRLGSIGFDMEVGS